jgi:hypothetical protein
MSGVLSTLKESDKQPTSEDNWCWFSFRRKPNRHQLFFAAQSLLERNRSAVGKTANSLVSPRRQQLAPSGRARLLLEPRRSAVLSSGLTPQGGGLGPFLAV